ncbi:Luc7-like protein 3, partial [Ophiophagus hannah]
MTERKKEREGGTETERERDDREGEIKRVMTEKERKRHREREGERETSDFLFSSTVSFRLALVCSSHKMDRGQKFAKSLNRAGGDLGGHLTIPDRWLSNLYLKTSPDGAPTTSGGQLFHWLIVLPLTPSSFVAAPQILEYWTPGPSFL